MDSAAVMLLLCVVREMKGDGCVEAKGPRVEKWQGQVLWFGFVEIDEGLGLETLISHNQGP